MVGQFPEERFPARRERAEHVRSADEFRQKGGHDVETLPGAGAFGCSDPVQLTLDIHENGLCLTANYDDFEELHWLIGEANGNHSGILVVRHDNDPARDFTPKGIVAGIRKLEAAYMPIANKYLILNQWQQNWTIGYDASFYFPTD